MLGDWVQQFAWATGSVLDAGKKVIVYSGKKDYICNYIGGEEWTNVTQWKEQVRERKEHCLYMIAGVYSASLFRV